MKRLGLVLIALLLLLLAVDDVMAQDTPTATATATATATRTATATATVTSTPTVTPPPGWSTGQFVQTINRMVAYTAGLAVSGAGLRIGASGTAIASSYKIASTVDLAEIAANTCLDTTITLAGAAAAAGCVVGAPATLEAGLTQMCFVSGANLVKLRTCNVTVGAVDAASHSYSVRVFN